MTDQEQARFIHQTCIYGSNEQFLGMALPFVSDGLTRGEPVLLATTPANLALLGDALGSRATEVDYAETAYFGRRTAQRVAAFTSYWARHRPPTPEAHVRILAEPVWAGRSPEQVAEWQLMESGLNTVLADTGVWMICPYDARTVAPDIVATSRRTHPVSVTGRETEACQEFLDPASFVEASTKALPEAPAAAASYEFGGELGGLRQFTRAQADGYGLTGERADLLVIAVGEIAEYLMQHGSGRATLRMWEEFGSIVCDVHDPAGRINDPFLGYRPPGETAQDTDGLWFVRQICDRVELHSDDAGCAVRLFAPSARAEELALSGQAFTS